MAYRSDRPTRLFRIADSRRPPLDGTGAALFGGRWNSPGRQVVYAAETYSGALLEILAHGNIGRVPRHHTWVEIEVRGEIALEECRPGDVPGWESQDVAASRAFGDEWHDGRRSAVLLVPSMTAHPERNAVLNCSHPDFGRLSVSEPRPVAWDDRLFTRGR